MSKSLKESMTSAPIGALVAVVLAVALAALLASPARAQATFTVNQTNDAPDAALNDSACDADAAKAGEQCTLRAAVQEANDTPGADKIGFSVDKVVLSVAGPGEDAAETGDLDILEDLTINGGGVVIGRPPEDPTNPFDDRIFHQLASNPATTVTIDEAQVWGGLATSGNDDGGGILSEGTLNLSRSDVWANITLGSGGGILSKGTLNLSQSSISENRAWEYGGGISANGGTTTISRSAITDNGISIEGGGIEHRGGTMTLDNSTVTTNFADFGGGVADNGGPLKIKNSTIAYNRGNKGGAGFGSLDEATSENSIVARNTKDASGNSEENCGNPVGANGNVSGGNNLEDLDTCGFDDDPGNNPDATDGDFSNTDPLLEPVRPHIFTPELLPGSPAIDAGDADVTIDQRGVTRPQDGDKNGTASDDIGSFERESGTQPPPPSCPNGGNSQASDDSYDVPKGKSFTVNAQDGVLKNDTDPEGDPLTAKLVSGPTAKGKPVKKATLTLNPDGSFTYQGKVEKKKPVTFVYEASDGEGGACATVTLKRPPSRSRTP